MSAKAFVLPAPWAHFDPKAEATGFGRKPLAPNEFTQVEAGCPVYLAVPSDGSVRVSGYRMGAQKIGDPYVVGGATYSIWLLSVGVKPSDARLSIEIDGRNAGGIEFTGYVSRPTFSAGVFNLATPEERAELLDIFLLTIIDLFQMVNDPEYAKEQSVTWERLLVAWKDPSAENTIPPMALIVKHAERLQSLMRDLLVRPRHILRRTRELTAVDRVQQLDIACVRWLSRQPGSTVYERAGPRQEILSVQRHHSLDTLENRVFADFSMRSHRVATEYTRRYEKLRHSGRWKTVSLYGRMLLRAYRDFRERGVTVVHPPIVPNFVLLQDLRYRRLWQAYIELLRQQDEEDECWRWQHRLWSDYVRSVIHLSFLDDSRFIKIADTPLRINQEQERGSWIDKWSQSGTFRIMKDQPNDSVLSMIWALDRRHVKVRRWMSGLGCQAVLHIQRLSDGAEAYIAIWAYHSFSANPPSLESLCESSLNAVQNCQNNARLVDDEDLTLRGLIIASNFFQPGQNRTWRSDRGEIIAFETDVSYRARKRLFGRMGTIVLNQAASIFTN